MKLQSGQWLKKLKQMKKDQWIVVVLTGILLLVIALPTSPKTESIKEEAEKFSSIQEEGGGEGHQVGELEARLESVLESVNGVGKVKVMITMKSSGKKVVEKDQSKEERNTVQEDMEGANNKTAEESKKEETVYVKGENGVQTPYVVEEKEPEIAGVVVVAEGGDEGVTAKNITDAVMALFGVEAHKIKVMKMN